MRRIRPTLDRFARFLAVGGILFPLNVGLTAALHELAALPEEAAFGIALVVVLLAGFAANRHFVFSAGSEPADRQLVRYVVASVGFRAVQFLSFLVVHTHLRVPYLLAVVVVLGFWLVVKFIVFRRLVFRLPAAGGAGARAAPDRPPPR